MIKSEEELKSAIDQLFARHIAQVHVLIFKKESPTLKESIVEYNRGISIGPPIISIDLLKLMEAKLKIPTRFPHEQTCILERYNFFVLVNVIGFMHQQNQYYARKIAELVEE